MKCRYCGGEVASDQIRCPFCNRINETARKRQEELLKEQEKTEKEYESVIEKEKPRLADIILRRTLIGAVVLFVLLMVFNFVIFLLKEGDLFTPRLPDNYRQTLETYYSEGRYEDIYLYVEKYNIFDPDNEQNYDYSQLALQYGRVINYRKCFYGVVQYLMDQTERLSDYDWEYMFDYGYRVLVPDIGVYSKISERNAAAFDTFKEEVRLDWMTWLGITEEEIDGLVEGNRSSYEVNDELDELMRLAAERLGISHEK